MKILHCIPTLGGGGAELQLLYLCEGLVSRGWEVHIAAAEGGQYFDRLRNCGVTIHHLRKVGNYDPRILVQLIKIIHRVRPEIVQTWIRQMDVLGGLAALLAGIPFVLTERTSAANYKGDWKDRIRLSIGSKAAAIVCNSEGGCSYWNC